MSLLLIFLITLLENSVYADQKRIRFSIGGWTPYAGKKMMPYGMAAKIVTVTCRAVGLQVDYQFFPWKRAEMNVANGSHFGKFPSKNIQGASPTAGKSRHKSMRA